MIGAVAAYVDVECLWNSKTGSTYGKNICLKIRGVSFLLTGH